MIPYTEDATPNFDKRMKQIMAMREIIEDTIDELRVMTTITQDDAMTTAFYASASTALSIADTALQEASAGIERAETRRKAQEAAADG